MATIVMTEKYQNEIDGILHCYDRIVINGHLASLCYAKGMTKYLYTQQIGVCVVCVGKFPVALT